MAPLEPAPAPAIVAVETRTSRLREVALITVLCLTLNLAGNARTSLWDRDEPRYAGCTREMRASGDYIHPTFNAEPRYHKPILIYWLMLLGTALGGDNPFGARLVSAVAGTGTCLLVWGLGRRMLGHRAGLLAALMTATAPIIVVESKLSTTDATLMFFLVACQFALWELGQRASKTMAALFWVALALATLTKGPVGPAIVAVSGLVSWWWGGPSVCWKRLRWSWGLSVYALLTAPWYIAIGIISKGEFYRISMGYHVVRRMTTGIETHGGFPGYYLALSMLVFYPWSALLPAGLIGAWFRRRSNPALGFMLGWIVGPLVMLELVRTKLIHYYLPSYPAWSLLATWLVLALVSAEVNLRRWPLGRVSLAILTGLGIGTTVALLAGALVLPATLRLPCLTLAVVMGAGTLFAMERFQAGATTRAAYGLVATWAALLWLIGVWLLPAIEPYRLSPLVAQRLEQLATSERATPMLASFQTPGVVYALGRPAPIMRERKGLIGRLQRDGAVVSALNAKEVDLLRRDNQLALDLRDEVRGFNIERAKNESYRLVVIRQAGSARSQEPDVK